MLAQSLPDASTLPCVGPSLDGGWQQQNVNTRKIWPAKLLWNDFGNLHLRDDPPPKLALGSGSDDAVGVFGLYN